MFNKFLQLLSFLVPITYSAQNSFSLNFEVQRNFYTVNDPGNHIGHKSENTNGAGIDFRHNHGKWFITSGLHLKPYRRSFNFGIANVAFINTRALQLPLLIGKTFYTLHNKIEIAPYCGVQTCFLPLDQSRGANAILVPDSMLRIVQHSVSVDNALNLSAVAGCELSIKLNKHYSLATFFAYNQGLMPVITQHFIYSETNHTTLSATKTDKGTYATWWSLKLWYHL